MRVTIGKTRSGKTFGCVGQVMRERRKIVVIDPQDSLSLLLLEQTVLRMSKKRILIDFLRHNKRTLQFINLSECGETGIEGKRINDLRREHTEEVFLGWRDLDIIKNPLIGKYLTFGLKMVQFSGAPLYWLPYAYMPWSDGFWWMKKRCKDRSTSDMATTVLKMSLHQQRMELEPALRLVEPICSDVAFQIRCGTMDVKRLLDENDLLIVSGGGASDKAIQIVCQWWIYQVIQYVEEHHIPVLLVVDEAANWDLVTRDTVRAICTLAKYGLDLWLLFQAVESLPEGLWEIITQNYKRFECYCVGSATTAHDVSEILSLPEVQTDIVEYSEESSKQLHDGYDEEGKSKYYGFTEIRDHYRSIDTQLSLAARDMLNLNVGQRYVRDKHGTRMETSRRLTVPGLCRKTCEGRLKKWIEQRLQGEEYGIPVLTEPLQEREENKRSVGSGNTSPPTHNSPVRGSSKAIKRHNGVSRDGQSKEESSV